LRIHIELPEELSWVNEELGASMDRALDGVARGDRPEYAAGYFAAVKDITDNLESKYQALLEERSRPRAVTNG
jgi:hypothetical protein